MLCWKENGLIAIDSIRSYGNSIKSASLKSLFAVNFNSYGTYYFPLLAFCGFSVFFYYKHSCENSLATQYLIRHPFTASGPCSVPHWLIYFCIILLSPFHIFNILSISISFLVWHDNFYLWSFNWIFCLFVFVVTFDIFGLKSIFQLSVF